MDWRSSNDRYLDTGGGKGNNMLYISVYKKKMTQDIIDKIVEEVNKKVSEIENK